MAHHIATGKAAGVSDEGGFTLVALLIVVAVINVTLAVAMTSWRTVDTRAREAELIWRGQRIAAAIACHAATEGTEPLRDLSQLVDSNCLRRLYRDPMSPDGKWRILRRSDLTDGTVAALLGLPLDGAAGLDGEPATSAGQSLPGAGASTAAGSLSARVRAQIQVPRAGLGTEGEPGAVGVSGASDIIGVMSQRIGAAMRTYQSSDRYEQWLFLGVTPAG